MMNSELRKIDMINPYTKLKWQHERIEGYISIIIPVYKEFKGLDVTLKSLQKQNYDRYLFEIIVANDGALPEVTKVAKKYNAVVVEISPNMGSYFARNRAIENARGEYFAFIDADMSAHSSWLASGTEKLKDVDYVAGNTIIDSTLVKTSTQLYELFNAFPIKQYFERYHSGVTANLFVRRNVFQKTGGFDQRLRSGGDFEFGDRVYRLGFKQAYMDSSACVHPPRDYKELKNKYKRTTKGGYELYLFYPDRFGYFNPTNGLRNFLRMLELFFPPTFKMFRKSFSEKRDYSIAKLYFLLWKLRLLKGWYSFFFAIFTRKCKSNSINYSNVLVKVVKKNM